MERKKGNKCVAIEPEGKTNNVLLKAVVRAHLWKRQLEEGKYASVEELSKKINIGRKWCAVETQRMIRNEQTECLRNRKWTAVNINVQRVKELWITSNLCRCEAYGSSIVCENQ